MRARLGSGRTASRRLHPTRAQPFPRLPWSQPTASPHRIRSLGAPCSPVDSDRRCVTRARSVLSWPTHNPPVPGHRTRPAPPSAPWPPYSANASCCWPGSRYSALSAADPSTYRTRAWEPRDCPQPILLVLPPRTGNPLIDTSSATARPRAVSSINTVSMRANGNLSTTRRAAAGACPTLASPWIGESPPAPLRLSAPATHAQRVEAA